MDSLQDIISRYDKPEEPEIAAIKRYVDERFHTPIRVSVSGNNLIITVPSASLANTLRLKTIEIKEMCRVEKRLVFRIG